MVAFVYNPETTPVFDKAVAVPPDVVTSPVRLPPVIDPAPENTGIAPVVGAPVVVTACCAQVATALILSITLEASATCPLVMAFGTVQGPAMAGAAATPMMNRRSNGTRNLKFMRTAHFQRKLRSRWIGAKTSPALAR